MSAYKPSDPYAKEFTTASPTTGAAQNADSLPVATANRNGTDDGTFALTVANIDAGRYKITGTIPAGYVKGDVLNVTVAATVGGVAGKAVVDTRVLDSKRVGDLADTPALTDYQQRGVAVTLPANPPAGFLVTASYGTAPAWYVSPDNADLLAVRAQTDQLEFDAAGNLLAVSAAAILGAVADTTPAAGSFDGAAGLSAASGFYAGSVLAFTSGANRGLARKVTTYTGSTHTFNFAGQPGTADAAFPQAPANGDGFMILGRIG
jgi:hypothetical protein